jgi:ABC-2 type transport system permease protein
MALNALLLPERRSRELTALFALAVVVIAFPVAVFLASLEWNGRVPDAVAAATGIVGLTPLAATQGFGFAIASGDVPGSWLNGIVSFVTLVAVWLLWAWLVRRLLTTTERPVAARERTGLGWFGLMPSNAFGAIAARSLVYWLRDRRYIVNIVVVPVAGILTVFPLLVAGVPLQVAALIPVPVMALFFGWLPHNDVAYDSTAFWTHVASGVRGVPDRLGRLVPIVLVAVPVLAVAIPITLSVVDTWYLLVPVIGLAACLFLTALGLSSISSVVSPYAVSHPGDSPFQQPQRSASRGSFGPAGAFVGALVLSAPTIWLFTLTIIEGSVHSAATFWAGLGTGVLVLAAGALVGGRIYERGGERLMEFVETA